MACGLRTRNAMRKQALNRASRLLIAGLMTSGVWGCSSAVGGAPPGSAGGPVSGSGGPSVSGGTGGATDTAGAIGSSGNSSRGGGMSGSGDGGRPGTAGMGPSSGGRTDFGGAAGSAGQPGVGGAGAGGAGAGGGTGTFNPCPTTGACKVLPLGDSITWGVNYDGGYRVQVFADATADKKSLTYVGKLSNGPATVSGARFPKTMKGTAVGPSSKSTTSSPGSRLTPTTKARSCSSSWRLMSSSCTPGRMIPPGCLRGWPIDWER